MSKKEIQAYRRGKREERNTILAMLVWTSIIIAMLIKAEIFVM